MTTETESATLLPDSAAVFASALSLWQACQKQAAEQKLNLSECYNGMDEFMREVMRVGTQFELWACSHIAFDETHDVWPYLLEDKFGPAFLALLPPSALAQFDEKDCLSVALHLRLPVILNDELPIPVNVTAPNPNVGTGFGKFRIQTVRNSLDDGDAVPFVADDDSSDEEFGERYFALYGVGEDGKLEHIADRKTYGEILTLAQKLTPGITFPHKPIFAPRPFASS